MNIGDIKIDSEFKAYLPENAEETKEELEQSVRLHGFTDPICVWKETGILIDGHHRYQLWISDQSLAPPTINEMSFDDRTSALRHIIQLQLARRNLSQRDKAIYRGRLYNQLTQQSRATGTRNKNADTVASTMHVSERQVRRDGKLAAAVDKIAEVDPALSKKVAQSAPVAKDIVAAANSPDVAQAAAELVKNKPSVSKTKTAPDAMLKKSERLLVQASAELVKAERACGGESVYSRKVLKSFQPLMAALEMWKADLTF